MSERLVIIGCGGLGREFHDVVDAINAVAAQWDVLGYLDDQPSTTNTRLVEQRGSRVLGGLAQATGLPSGTHFVIGIGDGPVRARIAERVAPFGLIAATLVHPSATIGFGVRLGAGTVVTAGVHLTTNIDVGAHSVLNLGVTVGHDTTIGDFVTINPNASVSGSCWVGEQVLVGTGAVLIQGRRVGAAARVGASACVASDVEAGHTVVGVPARPLAKDR